MAIKSGIAAQLGVKAESTYGTPVTVDRFYEFNSESLEPDIQFLQSTGIGLGRFMRHDRSKHYLKNGGSGQVELDVMNKDFGLLLSHAIGQDTITGGSADKTHTIIPDAAALQGKSLTVQKGVPGVDGTVRAFTFEGGKVTDWELKCAIDEILKLTLGFDFQNVLTATALATASYTATREAFIFTEGAITVGGSSTNVRSFSIKGNNNLATDRRFIAAAGTKLEPVANGLATIEGELECEFEDLTAYAAWLAGTQAALVLTFTSATVIPTTASPFSLTITIPKIDYTGSAPTVGGPELVMQKRPFRALYDGSNAFITIAYVTSDTAA